MGNDELQYYQETLTIGMIKRKVNDGDKQGYLFPWYIRLLIWLYRSIPWKLKLISKSINFYINKDNHQMLIDRINEESI